MDTSQGNIPEEGKVEETLPQDIPAENKPAEETEPKLPDGVAERTAQEFDKLKQHNAELKEKLQSYEGKVSVLDDLRPSPTAPVSTEVPQGKFIDENGFVDVNRLEKSLQDAAERANKAEAKASQAEARVQSFEESAQVRAAHAEFPQLDPHNTEGFDPKFYELVRNELIGQMMKGEQDIIKASRKVAELYQPKVDVTKAKDEAVKEYKTKITKRDQASSAGVAKGSSLPNDHEELVQRTLKGDDNALYRRLQASGN